MVDGDVRRGFIAASPRTLFPKKWAGGFGTRPTHRVGAPLVPFQSIRA
jgi:hypothetical protein